MNGARPTTSHTVRLSTQPLTRPKALGIDPRVSMEKGDAHSPKLVIRASIRLTVKLSSHSSPVE